MDQEKALGIFLFALLLGGVLLLSRKATLTRRYPAQPQVYNQGIIDIVPIPDEPKRYKNKETRRIEYNEDGLPTLIEITRDYAVT